MELLFGGLAEAIRLLFTGDLLTWHALGVSLICTLVATFIAATFAIPYGAWLGLFCPRARFQIVFLRVAMSIPTVLIGLFTYALFTRRGVFGDVGLLYTQGAIIFGETLLAFPLIAALVHGVTASLNRIVAESALTLGASRMQALRVALQECRPGIVGALLAAFGRCLTELGIVMTVGGNIALSTRTLTSTIQLEVSRGDFERALAAGIILLGLALITTVVAHLVAERTETR